jgi:hypothetical protein
MRQSNSFISDDSDGSRTFSFHLASGFRNWLPALRNHSRYYSLFSTELPAGNEEMKI